MGGAVVVVLKEGRAPLSVNPLQMLPGPVADLGGSEPEILSSGVPLIVVEVMG